MKTAVSYNKSAEFVTNNKLINYSSFIKILDRVHWLHIIRKRF